ncbi:MAG: hypothetical protein AAB262_13905 [Elusimicrobiota bacterium]
MFDYTKTVVGLDVHKESIVAAVLPPDSDRVALTTKFENTPVALKTFVERLRSRGALTFVYEAGPCGYQHVVRIFGSTITGPPLGANSLMICRRRSPILPTSG